jgi:hypothetical protein
VTVTFPATAEEGGSEPAVVSAFSLDGKVTVPVKGAIPDTTAIDEDQYTGSIAWQTSGGAAHTGAFAAAAVYKAVVTLAAKTGYTFTGVAADSFTYTGAASVTNAVNSGTVTVTFPATAEEGGSEPAVVSAFSLDNKVTAPVKGAIPDTTAINEDQYTGSIAWQTSGGAAYTGAFAAAAVYKAVVTLAAKTGYTFTGVGADSFTYTGATVTNAANSGTVTVTFPATAGEGGPEPAVVSAFSLDGKVTAPVRGAASNTTAINEDQYTGSIAWQTSGGAAHTGAFAAAAVYKAVVTLTAKTSYTFTGVGTDSFTYTGATSVANAANSGTVTVTFPATADAVVSAFSLDGTVRAPVRAAAPDTTAINETQYTGSIAWQTSGGTPYTGTFAADTVYKAVVTLNAKSGYTFTGLGADSFSYTGATVTNAEDSGTVTVTFPATEKDPNTDISPPFGNPSVKLYLDGASTPLTHNGTTGITLGTGTYTVSIDPGHSSIVWYLNGSPQTQASGKTSITLSKRTTGNYLVTVETGAGASKNSGAHTFTVQ